MRWTNPIFVLVLAGGIVIGLGVEPASVNAASDTAASPDWPCIQRLVPEVTAAVLWPIPIDASQANDWRADATLSEHAKRWGDLDSVDDDTRAAIQAFAESFPESERNRQLTLLAEAVLAVGNERRSLFIDGIKRYTRQQNAVAKQVEDLLNEAESLRGETGEAAAARRAEVQETLHWHQRVFEQRERAIVSLCEQPVAVEETLGEVLRELAQYLQ